jgi:hypothetical protein
VARRKGSGVKHCVDSGDARERDQVERLIDPTSSLPDPVSQVVSVSDDAVGIVERRDGYFIAIDGDGHIVGRFHDLKIAVRALPDGGAL